jgi:putative ABC transport system ATP-binding protein
MQNHSFAQSRPGTLIHAREVSKTFWRGQEKVEALRKVSFEIETGSFNVIMGPSGCGKSTLLHLLGGIDRPTSGALVVNGLPLHQVSEDGLTRFRREHIGFVFQFYNLIASLSALDNVALALLAKGWKRRLAVESAGNLLDQLGLAERKRHKPAELSGGEQQRVAMARAVAGSPSLVLADEPTGDLDSASAEGILQLMLDLNRRLGLTFVVATHNEALIRYSDRLFELRDGQIQTIE